MLRYLADGGALILVSHSPYLIQSVCNRGIYINSGKVQYAGTAVDALNFYLKNPVKTSEDATQALEVAIEGVARPQAGRALSPSSPIAIDEVRIATDSDELLTTDEPVRITLRLRSLVDQDIAWGFSIWTSDQWVCVTGSANFTAQKIKAGAQTISCSIAKLPLMGGTYMLKIGVMDAESRQPLALFGWEDAPLAFKVQSPATFLSNALRSLNQLVTLDVKWEN
jgi:lipopolysaccharide transport system ATP-binding protein